MRSLIAFVFLMLFFLLPVFVLAQECPNCAEPGGLVPCGRKCNDPETLINECDDCTLCHFFEMIRRVAELLLTEIVPLIAVLMVVITGAVIIAGYTGQAGPDTVAKAKKALTFIIIGLIVVYLAWLVINLFLMSIGVADWTGLEQWWVIDCL